MKLKSNLFLLLFVYSFSFSQVVKDKFDENIRSIFQDSKGNYWYGTNAAGVYRYDGKTLTQYTVSDGLSDNQVQSIQEDEMGNLWFGTGLFGVSKFDGKTFTTFSHNEMLLINKETENKPEPNSLWFYAGGGAFFYQNNKLT